MVQEHQHHRFADSADPLCNHHHAITTRIGRTEEDVQRLYAKIDTILWATLGSAGASILCLVGMIFKMAMGV